MDARPSSLYLHVPFCPQVCPYCDFHKMLRSERLVAPYLARMRDEIRAAAARHPGSLRTLYLGGGTPTSLHADELAGLLGAVDDAFGGLGTVETTVEADPGTFDAELLARLAALGVTRLSIGAQSFSDPVLALLGRSHDGDAARRAVDLALAAGFVVNVDVITAVPGQDAPADLHVAADLGVQHVSVYTLTIEPDTPFARRGVRVDEDRAADDYEATQAILGAAGLRRYEVSNHALRGFESEHNRVYWHGGWWLASGPSAAGFEPPDQDDPPEVRGVRTIRPPMKAYLAGAPSERITVDGPTLALELLMTGLRTVEGVDLAAVAARTGVQVLQRLGPPLQRAVQGGALRLERDRLIASDRGIMVLDAVLRTLFAAEQELADRAATGRARGAAETTDGTLAAG